MPYAVRECKNFTYTTTENQNEVKEESDIVQESCAINK